MKVSLNRLIPPSAAVSIVVASGFIGWSLWQSLDRAQSEYALYQAASVLTESKLTPPTRSQDAPKQKQMVEQKQMVVSLEETKIDNLFDSARQVSRSSFNFGVGGAVGLLLYVSTTLWVAQRAKKDLEKRLGLDWWGLSHAVDPDGFDLVDRLPRRKPKAQP